MAERHGQRGRRLAGACALAAAPVALVCSAAPAGAAGTPIVDAPAAGVAADALVVVLPTTARASTNYAVTADRLQAGTSRRLFVAIGSYTGDAPTPAEVGTVVDGAVAAARTAGWSGSTPVTVVADSGSVEPLLSALTAGTATAGRVVLWGGLAPTGALATGVTTLSVVGDADRVARQSRVQQRSVGSTAADVVVSVADVTAAGYAADAPTASVTAAFASGDAAALAAARAPIDATFAGDRSTVAGDAGAACAAAQHRVANLVAADAGRLTAANAPQADLNAFLYVKPVPTTTAAGLEVVTATLRSLGVADADDVGGRGRTPAGAAEVACKMKSQEAVLRLLPGATAAGPPAECAAVNAGLLADVVAGLPPGARARYLANGRTPTFGPDQAKTAGPEWVFSPLVDSGATGGAPRVVIAPKIVTAVDGVAENLAGMQYCKLWSPLKALDWTTEDAFTPAVAPADVEPPATVPEAPVAVLLPVGFVALAALVRRRRGASRTA